MGMRTTFSAHLRVGFHTTFLGVSYWASVNARIARHFNHTRLRRHSPKNKKTQRPALRERGCQIKEVPGAETSNQWLEPVSDETYAQLDESRPPG